MVFFLQQKDFIIKVLRLSFNDINAAVCILSLQGQEVAFSVLVNCEKLIKLSVPTHLGKLMKKIN